MSEGSTESRINNSLNEYMLCYQFGFFVHESIPLFPNFKSLTLHMPQPDLDKFCCVLL